MMMPFDLISKAAFYAVAFGVLVMALLTVISHNLFRAAIFLVFTLLGVALVYFFLHAEFIAAIQILIYVGAVMTLIVFAIMLTSRLGDPQMPQSNRLIKIGAIPVLGLFVVLAMVFVKNSWPENGPARMIDAAQMGKLLMSQYVLPFEIISMVLLAALIGAIVLSRTDTPEEKS